MAREVVDRGQMIRVSLKAHEVVTQLAAAYGLTNGQVVELCVRAVAALPEEDLRQVLGRDG